MADTPNGLASMTQARDRRARRAMPPPRHPVPANAAVTQTQPAEELATEAEVAAPLSAVAEPSSEPAAPVLKSATTRPAATRSPAPVDVPVEGNRAAARPTTLYLDNSHNDFLEEVHIAGLVSRPRIDISKSAVVRLALRRLQQDMTINEIRDHLSAQPTDPTKNRPEATINTITTVER